MIQTVLKRDGRVVSFNEEKLKAAIRKAMLVTEKGEDVVLIQAISIKLSTADIERTTAADLHDSVVQELTALSRDDAAKAYSAYRQQRDAARKAEKRMSFTELAVNPFGSLERWDGYAAAVALDSGGEQHERKRCIGEIMEDFLVLGKEFLQVFKTMQIPEATPPDYPKYIIDKKEETFFILKKAAETSDELFITRWIECEDNEYVLAIPPKRKDKSKGRALKRIRELKEKFKLKGEPDSILRLYRRRRDKEEDESETNDAA